jgi:hypothetical protein
MSEPVRFLFADNFVETSAPEEPHEEIVVRKLRDDFAIELAEARRIAHEEGKCEAMCSIERELACNIKMLGESIANAQAEIAGAVEEIRTEAMLLAVNTARKLADGIIAREPLAGLEEVFAECLGAIGVTPHIIVNVPGNLQERASELIASIKASSGYNGEVLVRGSDEEQQGNFSIEWPNGGMIRNRQHIAEAIDKSVERYLKAHDKRKAA